MLTPKRTYTIKEILLNGNSWYHFYDKHKAIIRTAIVTCVVKLLSCRTSVRGYCEYLCSNSNCTHTKRICFSCKSRGCSSCGKKATELWINKQNNFLPNTSWQHITFTIPDILWDFFWYNRSLFNDLSKLAANTLQTLAKKKKAIPGIFTALHTFGRDLKRNVHVHLSTTTGGITQNNTWKKLYFHQATLMSMWRFAVLRLIRNYKKLIIPPAIQKQLNSAFTFDDFLNQLFQKTWVVYCSKPSSDHRKNVEYLGRYIKRPAIAESKLRHYDGNSLTFRYLDHNTGTYKNFKLTVAEFIARFIQHIPDTGFRLIRYFGFLANRVRNKLLPLVYKLVNQKPPEYSHAPTYAQLITKNFGFDPLTCILCGQQLILSSIRLGLGIKELLALHIPLSLSKIL